MFDLDEGDSIRIRGGGFGFGEPSGGGPKIPLKVPVSILCGFLGAGKTTLVKNILQNRVGLKVGVVVNDVAEANIDSEVLKFEDADGIVGLQNGCACCSGRDDLFARLEELVSSSGISKLDRSWDRLVVECSGVAEPEWIARELEARSLRGDAFMKRIFLAGIVCVVDASTFWDMYNSQDAGEAGRKPLSALLVSQLESADTIIVNKTDLVSEAEIQRLQELLKALSPTARQLLTVRGNIPLRSLLSAEPVDFDMPAYVPSLANRHSVAVRHASTETSSSHHDHGHGHSHDHSEGEECPSCSSSLPRHDQYGLSNFLYRCRDRGFNPEKLAALVQQLPVVAATCDFITSGEKVVTKTSPVASKVFEGVVRSKGFVTLQGHSVPFYWSHAGLRVHLELAPQAASTIKDQEIVFIGVNLNRAAIVAALEACLEGDSEARL